MKKLTVFIVFSLIISTLFSCEKELMDYKGKEGVYFAVQHGQASLSINSWPFQPYSKVEFLRIGTSEVDFQIKVMITGPVKDYDRTFNIEVNPDSTTAILDQHYEAIKQQWTLPAGAVSTNISIRLKRTPDLDNTERKLGLRLVATPQLALSFPEWDAIPTLTGGTIVPEFDASLHTLLINNIMVTPAVWSGSIQQGNRESGLLGVFSKKKMQFLEEVTGVKYEDFASAETMPMARMNSIYKDGERVLIERYNAKNPVLEDDGRLMWMGSVPWMSYIGVPWVPAP